MASTSVLVELVCGELGIDASKPMVERVKAAAQLVGIDFVSVRATTEALAAQLLPVTQEVSSDDDVVLTHVETPRSKAAASLAEAVRTGAIVQIDASAPRRNAGLAPARSVEPRGPLTPAARSREHYPPRGE